MSQVVATALVADEDGFRLKRKWCSLAGVELCESLGIWNLVWGVSMGHARGLVRTSWVSAVEVFARTRHMNLR